MSPPSGTRSEYSRKHRVFDQDSDRESGRDSRVGRGRSADRAGAVSDRLSGAASPLVLSRGLGAAILGCALLGAVILIVAEFSTLYSVRVAGHSGSVQNAL